MVLSKKSISLVFAAVACAALYAGEISSRLTRENVFNTLSKMSPRARNEISVDRQNVDAFISDLQILLNEEKSSESSDISLLKLIDKTHKLSSDYVPKNLITLKPNNNFNLNKDGMKIRPECYDALNEMAKAAKKDGITLLVSSVYRSYDYQNNLFNYWVKVDGLEEAERESARPGTSQHQAGTAIDFGSISDDFAETRMGRWVYAHASEYGFSMSFPKKYEDVTGYRWESWHFRYIGVNACIMQKKWFNDVQQYMLEFLDLL